jgi:hypothetical protein
MLLLDFYLGRPYPGALTSSAPHGVGRTKKISVVVDVSSDVQIALTLFIELMMRAGIQYTNDIE